MTCEQCGLEFTRTGQNQRFCSDCAAERKKHSDSYCMRKSRMKPRLQPGENRKLIVETAAKARAAGMSYGEYMVRRRMDG